MPKLWITNDEDDTYLIDIDSVDVVRHHKYSAEKDALGITTRGSTVVLRLPRDACESFIRAFVSSYTGQDDDEGGSGYNGRPPEPGPDRGIGKAKVTVESA